MGGVEDEERNIKISLEISRTMTCGTIAGAGAEFIAYYSEVSDAWIVQSTTFVHVIACDTGERLYLCSY